MTIINTITYTLNGIEQSISLVRSKKLTHTGAQRILRKTISPDVCVTRIEAASWCN